MPSEETRDTKTKIIDVATGLYASRGFKGTYIRDIARAADTCIPNIYHYFGNKEGLLLAILEQASKRILDNLTEVCRLEDIEPLERFKMLVARHLNIVEAYINEAKLFFLDDEDLSEQGNKVNIRIQREILSIYVGQLRLLKEKGIIRYEHLTPLAFNVLALVNWFLRWYRLDGPMSVDEVVEEVVTFCLFGLVGRANGETQART